MHSLLLALLQMRRECRVGQCVSAQFQDSSARRCRRDLLLCFPTHPLLLVLTADCLNSDLDLCGVLSPLRQSLMKAIRATCLPQYAACATVQSLG